MMDFQLWLAFVAASSVLLLIPGPTIMLVLSYAISRGRQVALATAAGVALGDLIAMTTSLAGLCALVMTSATLFTALKWIGAGYLVWLGIGMLRSNPHKGLGADIPRQRVSSRAIFGHAMLVTALNPKSIAFFIAFVPQFVETDRALTPQFAVLIATFVGLASVNALAYALLADQMRAQISRVSVLKGLNRAGGVALISMGLLTATINHSP